MLFTGDWRSYIELLCHGLITFLLNKDHLLPVNHPQEIGARTSQKYDEQKNQIQEQVTNVGEKKDSSWPLGARSEANESCGYPVRATLGPPPAAPDLLQLALTKSEMGRMCDEEEENALFLSELTSKTKNVPRSRRVSKPIHSRL
eukprot:gb/GEZN01012767.1/.p3 GENE.gb/GEZN01012767.1/~~gb/GEZN01012767.1/.p3  ORF type:complete len:145 (-),score=16.69 gb/GEZN01012767.1/:193-627(-)